MFVYQDLHCFAPSQLSLALPTALVSGEGVSHMRQSRMHANRRDRIGERQSTKVVVGTTGPA